MVYILSGLALGSRNTDRFYQGKTRALQSNHRGRAGFRALTGISGQKPRATTLFGDHFAAATCFPNEAPALLV
jgi:hypothetical protein